MTQRPDQPSPYGSPQYQPTQKGQQKHPSGNTL